MGAVDLVVQVESPPSVASGLQRVGRAGHQVGAVSRGVVFPKYRGDLVQTAVVAERMRDGRHRGAARARQPARRAGPADRRMMALDDWHGRRAATPGPPGRALRLAAPVGARRPCSTCSAGRYPSDEFAELRPRLVWDRVAGMLTGRPGAQRLAVTSGGTIPDRGLFGVFLAGRREGPAPGRRARRGDGLRVAGRRRVHPRLDRRGGSRTSPTTGCWSRPRPGSPGRLPFWHGDALGRPAELGRAVGAFVRELSARCAEAGPRARCAPPARRLGRRQPARLPRRAARGHRPRARRPHDRGRAVPRRARRLAGRRPLPVRRAGPRTVGAGDRRPTARALRRRRPGDARRRRHRAAAARRRVRPTDRGRRRRRRVPVGARRRDEVERRSSPTRSAARRCSPPGSASARPVRCCCPAAIPAGARRCGSSGSALRSCCRSRASTARSRSSSRRCASACRTSSTCPGWSS